MMDYDEQLRESVMQNEVFARHVQVLRQEVGDDFEKPPGILTKEFHPFFSLVIFSRENKHRGGWPISVTFISSSI